MQLAWLTDPHMNFVGEEQRQRLYRELAATNADAVLVTGDIAEAESFEAELRLLKSAVDGPIYFVLGNHDYYRSSIQAVREAAQRLTQEDHRLIWLPAAGIVPLANEHTVLLGHGGWGDGRAGDFFGSDVLLNDYLMIQELHDATGPIDRVTRRLPRSLYEQLNRLGDEAAESLSRLVDAALQTADHVLVMMHVPPFHEACWHAGQLSDDNWAPHFVCQAAGEILRARMQASPEKQMTVLCGHTHGAGQAHVLPNLKVYTGGAEYGRPHVQCVVEVSEAGVGGLPSA